MARASRPRRRVWRARRHFCSARKTLAAFCLSLPARNEQGEWERREIDKKRLLSPALSSFFEEERERKCSGAVKANRLPNTTGETPAPLPAGSWRASFRFLRKHWDNEPRRWVRRRDSVLDCGSPLPLLRPQSRSKSARGLAQSKNLAARWLVMKSPDAIFAAHRDHEPATGPRSTQQRRMGRKISCRSGRRIVRYAMNDFAR